MPPPLTRPQALVAFPRIAAFIKPLEDTPKFYNAVLQALADFPQDFDEPEDDKDHDDPEEFALNYFDQVAEKYCSALENKKIFYAMFIMMCRMEFGAAASNMQIEG